MGDYRVIEHTADVGIEVVGDSLEDLFRQATLGLLEITGAHAPGASESRERIEVEAHDLGALLVDWLSEVLYLQDARDTIIGEVRLESVGDRRTGGSVGFSSRGDKEIEGTPVKAITYHQLEVEGSGIQWKARVFFDI